MTERLLAQIITCLYVIIGLLGLLTGAVVFG